MILLGYVIPEMLAQIVWFLATPLHVLRELYRKPIEGFEWSNMPKLVLGIDYPRIAFPVPFSNYTTILNFQEIIWADVEHIDERGLHVYSDSNYPCSPKKPVTTIIKLIFKSPSNPYKPYLTLEQTAVKSWSFYVRPHLLILNFLATPIVLTHLMKSLPWIGKVILTIQSLVYFLLQALPHNILYLLLSLFLNHSLPQLRYHLDQLESQGVPQAPLLPLLSNANFTSN